MDDDRSGAAEAAAALTAVRLVVVGGLVLAALTLSLGWLQFGFYYLPALTYQVFCGVCLARYWPVVRHRLPLALVPVAAVLAGALPLLVSDSPWWLLWLVLIPLPLLLFAPLAVRALLKRLPPSYAWAMPLLVGLLCFGAAGISILLTLLLMPVFAVSSAFAIARSSASARRAAGCLVLATTLGFGATWLGIALVWERIDWRQPAQWSEWRHEHGASDEHYPTLVVAGFPLMRVEGHGGGGARERLPVGKGLGALVANFLLCTAAAWGLLWKLSARALPGATSAGIVFALLAGVSGWRQLMWMLD